MKKIVMGIVILGLIFPFFTGNIKVSGRIQEAGTTGNIIPYLFEVEAFGDKSTLVINLENLTENKDYGILIGANTFFESHKWFNFTAIAPRMQIRTEHIGKPSSSSFLDEGAPIPKHPDIELLLLHLYGISSLEDSNPTFLDSYWYQIRYLDKPVIDTSVSTLLAGMIIIGAFAGIILTILKFVKN